MNCTRFFRVLFVVAIMPATAWSATATINALRRFRRRDDMFANAFATKTNLQDASRLPVWSRDARVSAAEVATLLACGALAAFAVGAFHLQIRVPGHAILRGVIPLALGFALVPRQSSGMLMSVGAGLAAAAMSWGHIGRFPPAAILSIVALGPVLDLALAGEPRGWRLYARFVVAGALTNLLAFAIRFGTVLAGWDFRGSRQFTEFWQFALFTFAICGAIAGLISAALWFRLSSRR
jgi:hypothetical protein